MQTWKKMLVGWVPFIVVAIILALAFNTSHLESFLIGAVLGGVGAQVGLVLMRRR